MAQEVVGGPASPLIKQNSTQYDSYIYASAKKYGVDPNLVKAVIQQESGYQANITSGAGAGGLMQLMPGTAKGLGVTNVFDPQQNIDGGTKYLSQLLKQFHGNVPLALAGYNAGAYNVIKYNYTVPPFQETQNYVKSIMANLNGTPLSNDPTPGSSTDTTSAKDQGISAFTGGIIKIVFYLLLFIIGVVFFMKAFPATEDMGDAITGAVNPLTKVKGAVKLATAK